MIYYFVFLCCKLCFHYSSCVGQSALHLHASSSSSSGIRLDKGASLYLCCFCPQQKSHAHKHHLTRTSQIVFSAELKWSALKRKEKTTQMLNLRSRCVLFKVRAHSDDAEMQRWGGHGGSVPWKRWPQSCNQLNHCGWNVFAAHSCTSSPRIIHLLCKSITVT